MTLYLHTNCIDRSIILTKRSIMSTIQDDTDSKQKENDKNLKKLTDRLSWDFMEPDGAKWLDHDDFVDKDDEDRHYLTISELKTIIGVGPMKIWMGCYSVNSELIVGENGKAVTLFELLVAMESFLSRKASKEEIEFFENQVLKNDRKLIQKFYPHLYDGNLRVRDFYSDSSFFEGPLKRLKKDVTDSMGRVIKAGTYGFCLGS